MAFRTWITQVHLLIFRSLTYSHLVMQTCFFQESRPDISGFLGEEDALSSEFTPSPQVTGKVSKSHSLKDKKSVPRASEQAAPRLGEWMEPVC